MNFGNTSATNIKYTYDKNGSKHIGEHNSSNKLHGQGISIGLNGDIFIGSYKNDVCAPGSYIQIYSSGNYFVGEYYEDANGGLRGRGTRYMSDGTTSKY